MIVQGEALWAKVIGEPQPGYDKSKLEWSIDLKISADVKKALAKEGIGNKVKLSKDGEYEYITFKRPGMKKDPKDPNNQVPATPIRIVGPDAKPWTGGKIGNGSIVNVSYVVNEVPYQGKLFKKPGILAIQVVEHVPYEGRGDEFEAIPVDGNGDEVWGED